ncbi:HET domain-containing protein [Aspergillus saccharolyticus JOP 1030-1]|uniref:HET-domain-containing protein n=1 Tax=Aspergillus saccharolyticus JOP 1030-1 TaxID=1450539 RepID=A0A318ZLF8_9EURO|nr:HET-domain-containing protein [Aspergillus saccharolyticus JOP 1030-1]PYH48356.1 HET-domain-containing protein [Aspergillus saccharolyticus JOP 1030-1]
MLVSSKSARRSRNDLDWQAIAGGWLDVLGFGTIVHIRPQGVENRASRPLSRTQATRREVSSWVGDHQRIPSVLSERTAGTIVIPNTFPRGIKPPDTRQGLEKGSRSGCGLCYLFLEACQTCMEGSPEARVGNSATNFLRPINPEHVQELTINAVGGSRSRSFYLYTERENPAATEIVARPPLLDVGSFAAFKEIKETIDECVTSHPHCPVPPANQPLPTRVIDCQDPTRPRLWHSGGKVAPYIALSYVWGEAQPYCTVKKNLNCYSASGIDATTLGQTIRDAIQVTASIGIRYLWIDALCIIQDSKTDKIRKLTRMGSIYRHAYLTLIASSAHTVSAGFLQTRALGPEYAQHVQLPFHCRDGRVGSVYAYTQEQPWLVYDALQEPVNTRAWCFQERLLSPRILAYATNSIQYHCHTAQADIKNAVSSRPVGEQLDAVMFGTIENIDPLSHLATWNKYDWDGLHELWRMIVANYTCRSLTNPEDKLIAFSSVVVEFDRVWRVKAGQYLAGLWEKRLPSDLLWVRTQAEDPRGYDLLRPRPKGSFAPTWSWASTDGRILSDQSQWDELHTDCEADCKVLMCNVTPCDENLPFGQVSKASLSLRAQVLPTPWVFLPGQEPEVFWSLYMPSPRLRAQLKATDINNAPIVGKISQAGDSMETTVKHVHFDASRFHGGCIAFECGMVADDTLLHYMGDITIWFDTSDPFPPEQASAIVVKRWEVPGDPGADGLLLVDIGHGQFERIGCWKSFFSRDIYPLETGHSLHEYLQERQLLCHCGFNTYFIIDITLS